MSIHFFFQVFEKHQNQEAIIWKDQSYSFQWLLKRINYWYKKIQSYKIPAGAVTSLEGDFSPESISILFALIRSNCTIVPLMNTLTDIQKKINYDITQVSHSFHINDHDTVKYAHFTQSKNHPLLNHLKKDKLPGLILLSSGSSGEPKAAVHDFSKLLDKYKTPGKPLKILNFLLFDHWGGLNTMLHTLSKGGTVYTLKDRFPDTVCKLIEDHKIEVLPTSPSFLNVLLLSEAYKNYNLTSLKIISYGTEPMPKHTLKKLKEIFSEAQLKQTYGLIEVGVLRSKSKNSDSLWVKIGGDGVQWRVENNVLQIKAKTAMLGYLNAPSPFTHDGWLHTGDAVEVDGEYLKILGRRSELINVGGEKVYPIEVENIIQEMENVADVTVYKEDSPIMGNIVSAKVKLIKEEPPKVFSKRLKSYCRVRLPSYKIPVRVIISKDSHVSNRFKKVRLLGKK